MRILILANNDVGLYKFRKELIEELLHPGSIVGDRQAEETEVYISLPNGEFVQPLEQMGCHFIETPIDRRGINPGTDLKLFRQYQKILKEVRPDKVVTYTIKPNIYGGIACRLQKIPYYVNITGLGTAFQRKGLLQALVTRMYRFALKDAGAVFFENAENKRVFEQKRIVKTDKCVLLNGAGVNITEYSCAPYPKDTGITNFLFVGRVMKEKGIDELLAAMEHLVSDQEAVHLNVVGPCEEDYVALMKEKEQEGWLSYHGYQNDVKPFIRESHCFVLPSWHEGMANTNLECAAMGRPVITSDIAGCREAVLDGKSGYLVQSKNVRDLYQTMKKFIRLSHTERESMGLVGRKHMEEWFDKRGVVRATLQKMNKAILINYTGRKGGGPIDAIEMTKGLISQGCKVIAVLSEDIENRQAWEQLPLEELIFIHTYRTKPEFLFRTAWFYISGRRKLAKRLERYDFDAIYCPMITFWTKMINDVVAANETIVVNHDPIPHSGDKYVKYNFIFSNDACYQSATKIIVHSEKFVSYVEERYNKKGKVFYLPLGRHAGYKFEADCVTHSYDPAKINYVFFGTISQYKGIGILLEAYRKVCNRLENTTLSIYGSGDFSMYQKQAEELTGVTVVNRWILDEEVASIFQGENLITVLPYLDATQSGAVLVSMDFGVPVIATNTGGLSEQIEDGVTGILVEPGNVDELADAMIRLAEDKTQQEKIAENVKKYLHSIEWDELAGRLLQYIAK